MSTESQKKLHELLNKLGIDETVLKKAEAITKQHTRPSKSRIIVRDAIDDIISFVHQNRATILPYAKQSYDMLNIKKTDDEMLGAYLVYMLKDLIEGVNIIIDVVEVKGFTDTVKRSEEERARREADVAKADGVEMI